ncbi:VENN motif pre-toxin domain-containing protein, partial [Gallibacterium salpingitidis]|uniref:VENN motif pre-toxin domain-containing protein n=4 Tax=Gallibacterium TaxID=155493 RepID=UPI000836FF3B
ASQAAVGGLSPYINHQIKEATTDKDGNVNLEANLMAHALLGAIEAYATGNNAAAGAAGAVSGELAAKLITEQLYQKSPEQLTEAQKQTVSALSQLASGLAGSLISDSTAGAINSAEIGKRAVENNNLATAIGKKAFPVVRNMVCTQKCIDVLTTLGLSSALILSQSEIEEAINAGVDPAKIAKLSDEQRRYINEQILNSPNSHLFLGDKVWIPNADGGFTPVDPSLVTTTYGGKQIIDPRILITHTGGIQYPADYELPTHTGGDQLSGVDKGSHVLPGSEIHVGDWKDNVLLAVPPNLTPEGAKRAGAFNEAKRRSGIPVSQQPSRTYPNVDRRGNTQPGWIYEFDLPKEGGGVKKVIIRDDAKGHFFGENDPQNRGPHFNDQKGGHYDY